MCARLLAFSNGDLQALFDRSDGFYRRQLVLTTKEKPVDRVDDPDLSEKMKMEIEGIFLWAFAGLQRLVANNFKFTESQRTRENREAVKRDNNNVFDFLESEGYIRLKADASHQLQGTVRGVSDLLCRKQSDHNEAPQLQRRCDWQPEQVQSRILQQCYQRRRSPGTGLFRDRGHWFILIYRCFSVIRCVRTYRETHRKGGGTEPLYVRTQRLALLPHILQTRLTA